MLRRHKGSLGIVVVGRGSTLGSGESRGATNARVVARVEDGRGRPRRWNTIVLLVLLVIHY